MADSRAEQLRLALGPYQNRKLFSDHFLKDILPTWPEFTAADARGLVDDLADLWQAERAGLELEREVRSLGAPSTFSLTAGNEVLRTISKATYLRQSLISRLRDTTSSGHYRRAVS
jgi:hypothetical protein